MQVVYASCGMVDVLYGSKRALYMQDAVRSRQKLRAPLTQLEVHTHGEGEYLNVGADSLRWKRFVGPSCRDNSPSELSVKFVWIGLLQIWIRGLKRGKRLLTLVTNSRGGMSKKRSYRQGLRVNDLPEYRSVWIIRFISVKLYAGWWGCFDVVGQTRFQSYVNNSRKAYDILSCYCLHTFKSDFRLRFVI